MLIDDLIHLNARIVGCDLVNSKKFLLKSDFVETCAEFVEDESFTETMKQMARLPFGEETHIFELQKPTYAAGEQTDVVTFICKEIKIDDQPHIQVHYLVGKKLFPYISLFNPKELERHPTGELSLPFRTKTTRGEPVRMGSMSPESELRVLSGAITLSSILAVLNSPKIIDTLDVNNDGWNAKRLKRKQKMLHNHTVVFIKKEIAEAVRLQNEGRSIELDSHGKRIHWRRGHFKHRATGTFWWSAHLAGAGSSLIEKRYDVTA